MECCEKEKHKKALKFGLLYGLIPHLGCIAFILFSILGVTSMTFIFKDLLLNSYFFYALIFISIIFATFSAIIYLKNKTEIKISLENIKKEWKYLLTLYGTTISINLIFFMFIFPLTANLSLANQVSLNKTSTLTLQVNIPCSGHAPLIIDELKRLDGISSVKFRYPNYFDINYDSLLLSRDKILLLDIFKTFKANITNENLLMT